MRVSRPALEDRYGADLLAMAVPKGYAGRLACLDEFIERPRRQAWSGEDAYSCASCVAIGGGIQSAARPRSVRITCAAL